MPHFTLCVHMSLSVCALALHDTCMTHRSCSQCLFAQVAVLADLVTPLQHFRGEIAAFPGLVDALKIGDQACAQLAARKAGAAA